MPCQYWWNDQWYDLTSFDNSVSFFKSTPNGSNDKFAAFNFCQKINAAAAESQTLGCQTDYQSALDAYATIINFSGPGVC